MIPEIGNFALMLALCVAVALALLPLAGAQRGNLRWMALARPAASAQFALVSLALACLVQAFVVNDFTVLYVASNSNSALPLYYRVPAVWGGHEGSLLLWVWMLAAWTLAVGVLSAALPQAVLARVLGVMGIISTGFLAFMLFTSNPFERLLPAPMDGRDLNPLLQDFGMIIHPPLLYMGYVGFSVAFAFAIAALLGGRLDTAWARWSRPWTMLAWSFLTLGIFMGSFWAYYELGWGGWWFWDPVENASFMPWLVGTALIHTLAVTEKRGSFRSWTVLLAIIAFSLSLLGTFLVRSGVLTSVHAFATDPSRGAFILAFLTLIVGGSLLLYAARAGAVAAGGSFAPLSREAALLGNNVLLLVAAATVLLGTLYPLFMDALGLGKISVGPPYFESVFVPLMLPLLVLLAAGPYLKWKQAQRADLLVPAAAIGLAIAAAIVLAWLLGASLPAALGLALGLWIVLATLAHPLRPQRHGAPRWQRLREQPRGYWGMLIAHAGLGVFVLGVTLVRSLEQGSDVLMKRGEQATVAGYTLQFSELGQIQGPNYIGTRGVFDVTQQGRRVATLRPEKRRYKQEDMPMTEAAIDRAFTRDLYVSLGEPVGDGAWIVRVQVKPFMSWVWAGCLLMAGGGLLAALDRRYRTVLGLARAQALPAGARP